MAEQLNWLARLLLGAQPSYDNNMVGAADDDTKRYMRYLGTNTLRKEGGATHMYMNGKWVRVPSLEDYLRRR